MQKLHFSTIIAAAPKAVWDIMLAPDTFNDWTSAFMAGSYYEGSWEQGAKIRFLAPGGSGMVSEIAENRPNEYMSIRHLGLVTNGVEDIDSDTVKSWAPAYENYRFSAVDEGTRLDVDMDVLPDHAAMMSETWPKALVRLKDLCETPAVATPS